MNNTNNQTLVEAIVKALGYTENGGAPKVSNTKAGKSGELKSIFQFEPDTWKEDAGKILGDPNAPLTPDNETYVVQQEVSKWLSEGKNIKQIASMWNAGEGEQDAYTGEFSDGSSSTGTNKEGINYNVPEYADKVENYTKQFLLDKSMPNSEQSVAQQSQSPTSQTPSNTSANSQGVNPQSQQLLQHLVALTKSVPSGSTTSGLLPSSSA